MLIRITLLLVPFITAGCLTPFPQQTQGLQGGQGVDPRDGRFEHRILVCAEACSMGAMKAAYGCECQTGGLQ